MAKANNVTVGSYLAKRLEQAGLRHIFGVPGDYVLDFFDILEESNLKVVCNCNELNAGYAADAYARLNGVSGVCVTYGVGGGVKPIECSCRDFCGKVATHSNFKVSLAFFLINKHIHMDISYAYCLYVPFY